MRATRPDGNTDKRTLGNFGSLLVFLLICGQCVAWSQGPPARHLEGVGVEILARIGTTGDVVISGYTKQPGIETVGPPFIAGRSGGSGYIARVTRSGEVLFLRYLTGFGGPALAHVDQRDSVWLLLRPDGESIQPDHDLTHLFAPNRFDPATWFYLARLDPTDGHIVSTTEIRGDWKGLSVDSEGSIWMGTVTRRKLSTTPDAFEPRNAAADNGLCCAGALIRLSKDADRVTYATYLGSSTDGVHTVAIDAGNNVYAAGTRVWKFSSTAKLLWSTQMPPSLALASAIGPADGDLLLGGCTTALTPVFYTVDWAFQATPGNREFLPDRFPDPDYPSACQDAFVVRFDPSGNLKYSTLVGGEGRDFVRTIQMDTSGRALVSISADRPLDNSRNIMFEGTVNYYMGRFAPDGGSVDFLTPHGFSGLYTPPPVFDETGDLVTQIELGSPSAGQSRVYLLVNQLEADPGRLPRVDRVILQRDSNLDYELDIRGEGFGPSKVVVTLNGETLPVQNATDSSISIARFTPRSPAEDAIHNQLGSTYTLRVLNNATGAARDVTLVLRRLP